jgi:hypothetical protein
VEEWFWGIKGMIVKLIGGTWIVKVTWAHFKERSESGTSWFDQLNKNKLYGFVV